MTFLTTRHSRRKRRRGPILLGQHQDEGCSTSLGACQGRAKATVTGPRSLQPLHGERAICAWQRHVMNRLQGQLLPPAGQSRSQTWPEQVHPPCVHSQCVGPRAALAATEPGGSSSRGLLSSSREAPAQARLLPTLAHGCRANQPPGASSRHPALASKPWLLHTGPRGDDAPSS